MPAQVPVPARAASIRPRSSACKISLSPPAAWLANDAPPKGDEKAFAEAEVVPLPEGFKHVEYPKWIGDVIVQNLDEEVALLERTEPKRKKGKK